MVVLVRRRHIRCLERDIGADRLSHHPRSIFCLDHDRCRINFPLRIFLLCDAHAPLAARPSPHSFPSPPAPGPSVSEISLIIAILLRIHHVFIAIFSSFFEKYVLTHPELWTKIYEYVYIKRPCPILMGTTKFRIKNVWRCTNWLTSNPLRRESW